MKKQLALLLCLMLLKGAAQSFHRGAVIISAGTGLEYYNTVKNYANSGNLGDTSAVGHAASANLNAALEIGISKRVGIGARGKMNSFFTDLDAVLAEKTHIRTADLLLSVNLHPIRRKKLDVLLGVEGGFSSVNVTFQNLGDILTSGKGPAAALYLEPRFYKKRFGFHVRLTLPVTQYKTLNTVGAQVAGQQYRLSDWQGRGYGVNFGVQSRLF